MKLLIAIFILLSSLKSYGEQDCSLGIEESELRNYRYVIVPGILNEILSYYMTEHRSFLMRRGVPANQIHRFNLSSFMKPDESAKILESKVLALPQDKELIFIAHSKGALETLYFLNKTHQKIRLKSAILIQGPLDGASITKLPGEKGFLGFLNSFVKKVISVSLVKAYEKSYSFTHIRKVLKDLPGYPNLLKKIIFVESSVEYSKLKGRFKPLGSQYKKYFGKAGDGVLMDTDHIPFSLKDSDLICKVTIEVDHSDLVKAAPWNSLRVKKIRTFMQRVLY